LDLDVDAKPLSVPNTEFPKMMQLNGSRENTMVQFTTDLYLNHIINLPHLFALLERYKLKGRYLTAFV
jgi:hypothetical protein